MSRVVDPVADGFLAYANGRELLLVVEDNSPDGPGWRAMLVARRLFPEVTVEITEEPLNDVAYIWRRA